MDTKKLIRKYVLQNAIKFKGKANPGAIISKVLGEDSSLREKAKEIAKEINDVVKEVNKLGVEKQTEELKKMAPEMLKKKVKKERPKMPELPDAVKGKVVTRFAPEPSKYVHVGHALTFLLNYRYAKKYDGKIVLRFEDTNPAKAEQDYVDSTLEMLKFLGVKPDKTVYVSDDIPKFYDYCEKLIQQGDAYVCRCERDIMQSKRHEGRECEHREETPDSVKKEWKKMLDGKYKEGDAILRLKIDMQSDNHAMRDPVVMRIAKAKHYRQGNKYIVWPMYDLENAVEEELCGTTHILRTNEFGQMRVELQEWIKDKLGFKKQTIVQYGRFGLPGAITKGREIRELMRTEGVIGSDDPRLVTIRALTRRGFVKEMYFELVEEVGLSPSPTNIDWTRLSAINRRILDTAANRYFFIEKPEQIVIRNAPEQEIELDIHPDKKGGRKFKTKDVFYVADEDFRMFKKNKMYRLMDCLNFKKKGAALEFDSLEVDKYREKGEMIIHWLPKSRDMVKVKLMMPDATYTEGLAEPGVKKLKEGDIVQFERFGFVRLDDKKKMIFWFGHK